MKRLILLAGGMLMVFNTLACDVCACYFGVQPQFDKNFAGLRLRYRQYYGMPSYSMGYATINTLSYDLWGRFYPWKKVQVLVSLPYFSSTTSTSQEKFRSSGIADAMILGQYMLLNNSTSDSSKITHVLFAGGGIKLPTGGHKVKNRETPAGSGSLDYLVTLNYIGRVGKFGLQADAGWKINTPNSSRYLYGNGVNSTAHFFMWFKSMSFNFLPHAGTYYERMGVDQVFTQNVENTGSSVLFASMGADVYYKSLSFQFSYQTPIAEDYKGIQPENMHRIITGFTVMF